MICSDETRDTIALILGLNTPPAATANWKKPVFGCTVALKEGPLMLRVTELGTDSAALQSFHDLQKRFAATKPVKPLPNFEIPAFQASDDVVVFVKDDKMLQVDPRSLPASVGPLHRTRRDLAYITAASILHCWTGG